MAKSRLQLRRYREERAEMVRQYIGAHWSEDAADRKVPINILSLYVNIVGRNLIAKNPRVILSTFDRSEKPIASIMQAWANRQIEQIYLAETLQRVVLDALFSVGICKVALATPADAAHENWRVQAGEPMAERVDFDDFVFDIHAKDFREAGYIGHRFRVPLEVVRESKIYGKQRKELEANEDRLYNLEGDERISTIGRGYYSNYEEYEDFIDLWEIYLPRHRKVVTIAEDHLVGFSSGINLGQSNIDIRRKALLEQDWLGPECGPYHMLALGIVPGNIMPKGPIQDVFDLHTSINNIARKLIRQAEDCKTVTMISGGSDTDAQRVNGTNDGESVRVDNPESIKQVVMTLPNQNLFQLMEAFVQRASWVAGNLEMMGGLSPQARTATQDKLLAQNASAGLADMQDRSVNFTAGVVRSLLWYWHHHPTKIMRTTHSLPGLPDISIVRKSYPDNPAIHGNVPGRIVRKNDYDDLDIKIDPYSLQNQTPQMRLQFIQGIVGLITPMMPLLQQQGIMFDANTWLKKVGEYGDCPDLQELFTIMEPPQQDTPPSAEPGPGPAQTERTYTRRSIGGDSQQAKEAANSNMVSAMANQNGNGQMQPAGAY